MTFNADELEMLAAYAKVRLGDTPVVDALEEYRRLVVGMDALEARSNAEITRRSRFQQARREDAAQDARDGRYVPSWQRPA